MARGGARPGAGRISNLDKTWKKIEPNLERISILRRQGKTESQIAKILDVPSSLFKKCVKKHDELAKALQDGRDQLLENLENTIWMRALGKCEKKTIKTTYSDAEKTQVKEIIETVEIPAPDVLALKFCLTNMCPEKYQERATNVTLTQQEAEKVYQENKETVISQLTTCLKELKKEENNTGE